MFRKVVIHFQALFPLKWVFTTGVIPVATGISFDLDPRVEPEDDVFGVHGTILFWRSEPRVVTLGNYGQHPPVVIPVTMGISFRFRSPGQARG